MKFLKEYVFGVADGVTGRMLEGCAGRYVVRQYRTEWSEDAFCGTPGWGAIRLLLAVASLMRWRVMP